MIAYAIMVEKLECSEPQSCTYRHQCSTQHAVRRFWEFYRFTAKLGTAHGHLARIAKDAAKYAGMAQVPVYTGDVKIMKIDSEKLEPAWGDAEVAAYKLGGIEAVKRLQKGVAAEARAAGRALAKQLKDEERARIKAARKKAA